MTTVAIVGASDKPTRYAYKAQQLLMELGYTVIPVSRRRQRIFGITSVDSLGAINQAVDTVTLYVGPDFQSDIIEQLISLKPRRVIFNPGAENPVVYPKLQGAGIHVEQACTLVLLKTGQF